MSAPTLRYRHNTDPHRGLATAGVFLVKFLLAVPHLILAGLIQLATGLLGYAGYWAVAVTGRMPPTVQRLAGTTLDWTARTWGWVGGIVDIYPPFETDPDFPIAFPSEKADKPSRGLAVAGILLLKLVAAVPHLIVLTVLGVGAIAATWIGYVIVAFTGGFPTALQDFLAGVLQWDLRVAAWLAGLTDEYPPFALEARAGG